MSKMTDLEALLVRQPALGERYLNCPIVHAAVAAGLAGGWDDAKILSVAMMAIGLLSDRLVEESSVRPTQRAARTPRAPRPR